MNFLDEDFKTVEIVFRNDRRGNFDFSKLHWTVFFRILSYLRIKARTNLACCNKLLLLAVLTSRYHKSFMLDFLLEKLNDRFVLNARVPDNGSKFQQWKNIVKYRNIYVEYQSLASHKDCSDNFCDSGSWNFQTPHQGHSSDVMSENQCNISLSSIESVHLLQNDHHRRLICIGRSGNIFSLSADSPRSFYSSPISICSEAEGTGAGSSYAVNSSATFIAASSSSKGIMLLDVGGQICGQAAAVPRAMLASRELDGLIGCAGPHFGLRLCFNQSNESPSSHPDWLAVATSTSVSFLDITTARPISFHCTTKALSVSSSTKPVINSLLGLRNVLLLGMIDGSVMSLDPRCKHDNGLVSMSCRSELSHSYSNSSYGSGRPAQMIRSGKALIYGRCDEELNVFPFQKRKNGIATHLWTRINGGGYAESRLDTSADKEIIAFDEGNACNLRPGLSFPANQSSIGIKAMKSYSNYLGVSFCQSPFVSIWDMRFVRHSNPLYNLDQTNLQSTHDFAFDGDKCVVAGASGLHVFSLLDPPAGKLIAHIDGAYSSVELSRVCHTSGDWNDDDNDCMFETEDDEIEDYSTCSPYCGFPSQDTIDRLDFGNGSPIMYGIKNSRAFCYWYTLHQSSTDFFYDPSLHRQSFSSSVAAKASFMSQHLPSNPRQVVVENDDDDDPMTAVLNRQAKKKEEKRERSQQEKKSSASRQRMRSNKHADIE